MKSKLVKIGLLGEFHVTRRKDGKSLYCGQDTIKAHHIAQKNSIGHDPVDVKHYKYIEDGSVSIECSEYRDKRCQRSAVSILTPSDLVILTLAFTNFKDYIQPKSTTKE